MVNAPVEQAVLVVAHVTIHIVHDFVMWVYDLDELQFIANAILSPIAWDFALCAR